MNYRYRTLVTILGALLVIGCAESKSPAPIAEPVSVQTEPTQTVMGLPVSLNTVMVAMINQAADPLWVAAWSSPETEADWRELQRRAVQLELGGTLLSVPGTGPLDAAWTGSEAWQNWSTQLSNIGGNAVAAVQARDIEKISAVGDDLVEVCEGCHLEFKPALPTGGEFGELSPNEADVEGP